MVFRKKKTPNVCGKCNGLPSILRPIGCPECIALAEEERNKDGEALNIDDCWLKYDLVGDPTRRFEKILDHVNNMWGFLHIRIGSSEHYLARRSFEGGFTLFRDMVRQQLEIELRKPWWKRKSLSRILWNVERTQLPKDVFEAEI